MWSHEHISQWENYHTSAALGFTFIICGESEAGHCLQAVGAAHHQRTSAPLRLGGAGGGPRAKATNSQRPVGQVNQLESRL